jgi:succinate dehydrogenase hydrophobic anchor subunit
MKNKFYKYVSKILDFLETSKYGYIIIWAHMLPLIFFFTLILYHILSGFKFVIPSYIRVSAVIYSIYYLSIVVICLNHNDYVQKKEYEEMFKKFKTD